MNKAGFALRGSQELETTLRRVVVIFRFLGLTWMLLLVAVTLIAADPLPPRLWIVWASAGLAVGWTFLTWYMARALPAVLGRTWWFLFDSIAMLAIGAASVASGADELFHGGLPLSYVFVGALWGGLSGSLVASVLLAAEQFAVHVIADLGAVRAAGSVIFFIVAAIVGWTFSALRRYDNDRREAQEQLAKERTAVAMHEERAALADRLHDSILQTLHAIRMGADDPAQSKYLARRQERELRRNIEGWQSELKHSFKQSLLAVRDDIEDVHRVEIEAVIRDDAEVDDALQAAIETAREALTNAVKHSGSPNISVFAEFSDAHAKVHVRDSGSGIADEKLEMQVHRRLSLRVEKVGGQIEIESGPEKGTEIIITVER